MANNIFSTLARKSNDELLSDLRRLARAEHDTTAAIIAHLAEVDAREIFLAEGFNSLFVYCLETLGFSEEAAYNRIKVARAARRFPVIIEMLAAGSLNVTAVRLLGPHLTEQNHRSVLESAKGKRRREVEAMVARLSPQPDVPTSIRKLPAPKQAPMHTDAAPTSAPAPNPPVPAPPMPIAQPQPAPARFEALSPDRFKLQLTVSGATVERLQLAKDMLRHAIPSGDEAEIIDRALVLLLEDLARKKFAEADRPRPARDTRPDSRHIPAAVKRAVWLRDLGRCAFTSERGRRCNARAFLEFHHVVPFAAGGEATVENVSLRCAAHNGFEAERFFGAGMKRGGGGVRESHAGYGWGAPSPTGFRTSCHAAGVSISSPRAGPGGG